MAIAKITVEETILPFLNSLAEELNKAQDDISNSSFRNLEAIQSTFLVKYKQRIFLTGKNTSMKQMAKPASRNNVPPYLFRSGKLYNSIKIEIKRISVKLYHFTLVIKDKRGKLEGLENRYGPEIFNFTREEIEFIMNSIDQKVVVKFFTQFGTGNVGKLGKKTQVYTGSTLNKNVVIT